MRTVISVRSSTFLERVLQRLKYLQMAGTSIQMMTGCFQDAFRILDLLRAHLL